MPRVSRKPLSSVSQAQLWDAFVHAIISLKDQKTVAEFLLDLLTPAERLMLTKRLAAAILLEQGHSFLKISRSLNLSTATVGSIKRSLRRSGKGYRTAVKILQERERKRNAIEERKRGNAKRLDGFFRSLIPPVTRSSRRTLSVRSERVVREVARLPEQGSRTSFGKWQRNLKQFSHP